MRKALEPEAGRKAAIGLHRVIGLGAKGDGLAMPVGGEGAPVAVEPRLHVPFVLPGELVRLEADGVRGATVEIIEASSARVEPVCSHFTLCGGCGLQHVSADVYRDWKGALVCAAFAQQGLAVEPWDTEGVGLGARRRVVFAAETGPKSAGGVRFGFHAARSHDIVEIAQCPIADDRITARLSGLRELARLLLSSKATLRLSVLAADNGVCVDVTGCERELSSALSAELATFAKTTDLLRLTVNGDPLSLLVKPVVRFGRAEVTPPPGAFLQAAHEAEALMARITVSALPKKAKRAADLFCGLGALTFPLAEKVPVFAADSASDALRALENGYRAASGLKAIETRRRDLISEPLSRKELEPFDLVVFDPPRSGARAQAAVLAKSKVPVVVAVSCNPATLARDVRTLVDGGYTLERVQPIDQFLYSHHVEAVAVLKRVQRR